jgi:hypothetical protein
MDLAVYFDWTLKLPLERPGQKVEEELKRLLRQLKDPIPIPGSPAEPR